MSLWKNQPGYSVFSDENAVQVYSPVPEKYRMRTQTNNFGMVLRPRIPLSSLNVISSLSKVYAPIKSDQAKPTKRQSAITENTSLKRKVKGTINRMTEKITGKVRRQNLENGEKSPMKPYLRYRDRVTKTPLTPHNPFNGTPTPNRRRSKRLSAIGFVCSPYVHKKSPIKRKRDFKPDEFNNHLELVQSGIRKLNANSNKLTAAIEHDDDHPSQKKPRTSGQITRDRMTSTRTQDRAQNNSKPVTENSPPEILPFRGGRLRRTMTRVSISGRRLSTRFAKSATALDARLHDKPPYEAVATPRRRKLKGESNKALWQDEN